MRNILLLSIFALALVGGLAAGCGPKEEATPAPSANTGGPSNTPPGVPTGQTSSEEANARSAAAAKANGG